MKKLCLLFCLTLTLSLQAANIVTTFNASGNWTCPAGVTSVQVEMWGGGGGGGGVQMTDASGGTGGSGGGGGAYTVTNLTVTPGTVYAVGVGTGGAGGTGNNANSADGLPSTFPGAPTANGGIKGLKGPPGAGSGAAGGAGATAANNPPNHNGGAGGPNAFSSTGGAGGKGGGGGASGSASINGGAGTANTNGIAGSGGGNGGGARASGGNAAGINGSAPGGGGGGAVANGSTTSRGGGDGADGRVTLTYPAPELVVWQGNVNPDWDIDTTANWTNSTGVVTNYSETLRYHAVQFDDTASGFTVNIVAPVVPYSVLITNNANNYVIGGAAIGGLVGLTKTGSGQVTLSNANTYTGLTVINAGTLKLGSSTALGDSAAANYTTVAAGAAVDLNGQNIAESFGKTSANNFPGFIDATSLLTNSAAGAASVTGTINMQVSVGGAITVGAAGDITLATVRRNGGTTAVTLNKTGAGTLTLGGGEDNIGLSLVANTGTTVLAKASTSAIHAIGNSITASNSALVQLGGSGGDQILTSADVVLNDTSSLNLNGLSEGFDGLDGAAGAKIYNPNASTAAVLTLGEGNTGGTFAGVISDNPGGGGTLGLIKTGTGNLTLSGTNTYSGGTTINNGTLTVWNANPSAGAFTNGNGGTLNVTLVNPAASLAMSSYSLGTGCTNTFNFGTIGSNTATLISISGALEVPANVTVSITGTAANFVMGTNVLLQYTPGNRTGAGAFVLGTTTIALPLLTTLEDDTVNGQLRLIVYTPAVDTIWAGGIDGSWINAGNWSNSIPTFYDTVIYTNNSPGNLANQTLDADTAVGKIAFKNLASPVTISGGGAFTLTNVVGVDMSAAGADLTVLADYVPYSVNHNLTVGANRTLTLSNVLGNINTTGGGNISGPGTVRVVGAAGVLRELTNAATLVIDGGNVSANQAPLTTAAGVGDTVRTVITNGGSLNMTSGANGNSIYLGFRGNGTNILNLESGSITMAASTGTSGNALNLGGGTSTAIFNMNGGTITFPPKSLVSGAAGESFLRVGAVSGATGILNLNGGTAVVPLFATVAGSTSTINFNGTTVVGNKTNDVWLTGMTAANVRAGGAIFDSSNYSQTISQALQHDAALGGTPDGGLTKLGVGTLTLSGSNSFSGPVSIAAGTLKAGHAAALGSTTSGTTVSGGATLDVGGSNLGLEAVTVSGAGVNGGGAILNSGAAQTNALRAVTLTADTTFGGTTAWHLRAVAGNDPGLAGGGFKLTKVGANAVTIDMNAGGYWNPGLGDIEVQAGALRFGNNVSLGQAGGVVTLRSNAMLSLDNTGATNGITKALFALTNATIELTNGVGVLTTPVSLTDSNRFTVENGGTLTVSNEISGAGSLNKTALDSIGGTLVLTASNSYTGLTLVQSGGVGTPGYSGVLAIRNPYALGDSAAGTTVQGGARLQLLGTLSGPVAEPLNLSGNGGNANLGTLQNQGGTNTYSGAITLAASARIYGNGGILTLDVPSGNAITAANFPVIFDGATGSVVVNDPIALGTGVLTKNNTGKLILNSANTAGSGSLNNGTMIVNGSVTSATVTLTSSGAVLGGDGSINGNVINSAGGRISPGDNSIGKLTISGNLTLSGLNTNLMELNTTNAPATNDQLVVSGTITPGNTIIVTNLGPALMLGDTFVLFNQPVSVTNVILPPLVGALAWTNKLAVDGSIQVVVGSATAPTISSFSVSGTDLILGGTGGTEGASYYLLTATNVALPRASWTPIATNVFGPGGIFSLTVTNGVSLTTPQQFYLLQLP